MGRHDYLRINIVEDGNQTSLKVRMKEDVGLIEYERVGVSVKPRVEELPGARLVARHPPNRPPSRYVSRLL
jgi:hypothetical protein